MAVSRVARPILSLTVGCERYDEGFCRTHYNSDEDWDVVTMRTVEEGPVRDGDDVAWNALLEYVQTNDLSVGANYQAFGEIFDIPASGWLPDPAFFAFLCHDVAHPDSGRILPLI